MKTSDKCLQCGEVKERKSYESEAKVKQRKYCGRECYLKASKETRYKWVGR